MGMRVVGLSGFSLFIRLHKQEKQIGKLLIQSVHIVLLIQEPWRLLNIIVSSK